MQNRIIQCFNKGAATYDDAAILQDRVAQRLLQRLPLSMAGTILEIGCGTGRLSEQLIKRFSEAQFVLLDIAPAMIARCQERFAHLPHVQFWCRDGEENTSSSSFDLIVSSTTLQWFSEIQHSLHYLFQQLKPGGQLFFAMLGRDSLREWRMICEKLALPFPMPFFPSLSTLQTHYPEIQWSTEIIEQPYTSVHDFLSTLKAIGATATLEPRLSIASLRRFLREFKEPLTISYDVIFGYYKKP